MSTTGRILVIRGGAIGDFILTLPVLAALKKAFPAASVEVMTYPRVANLATQFGHADRAHSIESRAMAGFFARGGGLDFDLSRLFSECHVIFSYLYDPDEIFRANLARVTRAQVIQGIHHPDDQLSRHASEQLLSPLEKLAIFDADPVPRITVPAASRISPGSGSRWIAAHPGSSTEAKNWPREFWSALLRSVVAASDFRWLLVGGEAEGSRLSELAAELPAGRAEVVLGTPLAGLACRLAAVSAFVGHDSGPSHLAAALGIPGVALWRHTNAAVWAPRGGSIQIVREGDPEAVASLVTRLAAGG